MHRAFAVIILLSRRAFQKHSMPALAVSAYISPRVISADVSVSAGAVYTDISLNYRKSVALSRAGSRSHRPPGDLHI